MTPKELVPFDASTVSTDIQSPADVARLENAREDIRTYLEEVAKVYDPMEQRLKQNLIDTKQERRQHEQAALQLDDQIKAALSQYLTRQHQISLAAQQKIQAQMEAAQQEVIAETAVQMVQDGDAAGATALVASPPEVVLPIARVAPGGTTVHGYELIDIGQVKREYLKVDDAKVRAAARQHRQDAEKIVGGIKYVAKVTPRRKPRSRK
jgi:hypothetical protein